MASKADFVQRVVGSVIAQNLQPPLSPFDANRTEERRENGDTPWVIVGSNEDMDARDPRWFDLFQECFLKVEDTDDGDDLLFFVRQAQYDDNSVFVRRRVGTTMPKLEDVVDWKGTFWLNLAVHLPCRLTVTVCERQSASMDGAKDERPAPDAPNGGENNAKRKMIMRAKRRNSRKVFATPYKSNMQLKDTGHEPSFPLVYYAVNNFEDAELHLDIQPNEWLCVELAAVLPQNPVSLGQFSDDDAYYELSDQSGPLVEDLYSPFPCPPSATKVVFFQGAASFSALAQVFAERSSGGFPIGKVLFGKGDKQERKEYITMRGPRGKGQCEVAVEDGTRPKDSMPSKGSLSNSSVLDRIRRQLNSGNSNSSAVSSEADGFTLRCSLTYINVHFAFVASDLLQWAKAI